MALLCGFAVPVQAAQSSSTTQPLAFQKLPDGSVSPVLATTPAEVTTDMPQYASTDIVRVSIVLESGSTLDQGYSTMGIAQNPSAMAYRQSPKDEQVNVTAAIESAIGTALDVKWNLTLAANLISANIAYGDMETIANVPGVSQVFLETRYTPDVYSTEETADPNMATSGAQIGSNLAWANGCTGAGSRIAIIDTGTDTDHQSFSAAAFNYSLAYLAGKAGQDVDEFIAGLDLLDAEEIALVKDELNVPAGVKAEDLFINTKLPFGYNYIDENLNVTHDGDTQGSHGSHVAGIATANSFIPAENGTFLNALDSVKVQGVAPDAQLITMKVFGAGGGAYDSDYMAAVEDAIVLGCDSVNLSLGSAAPGFSYNKTYAELLNRLTETDTIMTTSAGNNATWATNLVSGVGYLYADDVSLHSGGSPGSYVNSFAVASVDNDGATGHYFTVGDLSVFFNEYNPADYSMDSILTLAGEHEYIFLDSIGTDEEFAALADVLQGKIAFCYRGTTSFYQKAIAAVNAGAIATIICNNQAGIINMNMTGYTKTAPCVSILQTDADAVKAASTPVTDEEGNVLYYTGKMTIAAELGSTVYGSRYYTISSFSSWGVPGSLIMKPEITAPGGSIYSVNGLPASGDAYEIMSGTSMSAPQVAGMVALVKQYIRETGLAQKTGMTERHLALSLLMSTAVPMREEASGGNYWSVLAQGSGLANVGNAITAESYITMNEGACLSWADGKVKAELGDDPQRKGEYTFSFNLNNFSEEDKVYTLTSDFFTQAVFAYNGETYLDTWTTPLAPQITFTADGETFLPVSGLNCDLDADGDTDADDAQMILNYCAGLTTEIDPMADVSTDGKIGTDDAQRILASLATKPVSVPAGGKVSITVKIVLTEGQKALLDENYVNGAYVEGFVFVRPTADNEGAVTDVTHSIPVLGFYGNWSDPSMFDNSTYTEYLYGEAQWNYTNQTQTNNLIVRYGKDTTNYWHIGNPYFIEKTYPEGRNAINTNDTMYQYILGVIRNMAGISYVVLDEEGNVLHLGEPTTNFASAYYYTNGGYWTSTVATMTINQKPASLGVEEGDIIQVGAVAIPEYYAGEDGIPTSDEIRKLIEDGVLGQGAFQLTTLKIDNTAPTVTKVNKDLLTGNLTITASDNNYIALVQVSDPTGSTVYAAGVPTQTAENQTLSVTMDLSEVQIGETCLITVADYAGNTTAYEVEYGGEPLDFSGRMFAFTSVYGRGSSGNRWMEFDTEKLYYYNTSTHDGMELYSASPIKVIAAEYVDGYVIMATDDDNFYAAKQESLNNVQKIGAYGDLELIDMAFNYADGQMYALVSYKNEAGDNYNNEIYTVDLATGKMKYQYTVNQLNARNNMNTSMRKFTGLAIDDMGNFYSTNYGSAIFARLYKWNNAMAVDGLIDELPAVNTGTWGYTSVDCQYGSMAWDHDEDVIYITSNNNATSAGNGAYLYQINPETGIGKKASNYSGGKSSSYASRTYMPMFGLYIVPSTSKAINPTDTALGVALDKTEMTVVKGTSFTLNAEVKPWLLKDKSVTWTTSDANVATVDELGNVKATGLGTATITVTTNAQPNLTATCTVTVEKLPTIELSGLVYDVGGDTYWSEFTTDDPTVWTAVSDKSGSYLSGTLKDGIVYTHNGSNMFGIDPETFETTSYGVISSSWIWSDAAAAPLGYRDTFNGILGLCNSGNYVELLYPESGTLVYWDLSGIHMSDPMATIAHIESGYYHYSNNYPNCPANYYYMLTEGGQLWKYTMYTTNNGMGYNLLREDLGNTGLLLPGVSAVTGGKYASMIYDEATGYLIVSAYLEGDSAKLYAIDVETLLVAEIGDFGKEIWPVVSLYQHERATDLTVRLDKTQLELSVGDTASVSARVLPAGYDTKLNWSSSDETVATVDANGVITALKSGEAVITATTVAVNEAGNPATASVNVKIEPLMDVTVNTTVNAQITTANGPAWVTFNTANLSTYTTNANATTTFTGAGVHGGKIYGTNSDFADNCNIFQVDPSNGYAESLGSVCPSDYAILDMTTTGPAYVMDNNGTTVEAFDVPMYISNSQLIFFLLDYSAGSLTGWQYNTQPSIGAVAYAGEGTLNSRDARFVYGLNIDGTLYRYGFTSGINNGNASYSMSRSTLGNVGLSFNSTKTLSMVYVDDGTNTGLIVADAYNDAADIYWIDLSKMSDGTVTSGKLGRLAGATGISGLYTNGNLVGTTSTSTRQATAEVASTETFYGTNEIGLVASTDMTLTETNEIQTIHQNHNLKPAAINGSLETTDSRLTVALAETAGTTNGKLTVKYDPAMLTYEGITANTQIHATSVDAENGLITFTYADAQTLNVGKTIASVSFTYAKDYAVTELTITTLERNGELTLQETTVLPVTYEVGGHSYAVTESLEPTCTEGGYKLHLCSKCGGSYRENLEPLGHDYAATVTEATCTSMGYTTYVCTRCQDTYKDNYVDALGHNCEARVVAPTCTEMGYTDYTCLDCGYNYQSDLIPALGHTFGKWTVTTPATCTTEGMETRTCECGETETRSIGYSEHNFGAWTVTKAATCTEKGEETRTCDCGETETRTIDALGHNLENETVAPTCTAEGYTAWSCTVCGHNYRTDFVPALGHEYQPVVIEPTCTEVGYTLHTCTVCGGSYTTDYVSATGHNFGEWEVSVPATCFTDGEEVRTCATCGETETRVVEKNSDNCPSTAFADLNTDQWYHEAVDYVLLGGLMNGVGDDKFAPNGTLSRAQLVTILYRLKGEPSVEGLVNPFTDVAEGTWYTNATIWAVHAGVVTGVSETVFNPNGAITREQIATILYRYTGAEKVGGDYLADFTDADKVSAYAQDAIVWAVANGLINGMGDGTLAPQATATRAQIATILMRYCQQ